MSPAPPANAPQTARACDRPARPETAPLREVSSNCTLMREFVM